MLNKIVLQGRMCADPELRRTSNGDSVTSFSIAVDRDYKNQDGTRDADFFQIVAWKHNAEWVSNYFSKGRMVIIAGKLQNRDWIGKDGIKRRSTEIVADNIYPGDSKRKEDSGNYAEPVNQFTDLDGDDSELPF